MVILFALDSRLGHVFATPSRQFDISWHLLSFQVRLRVSISIIGLKEVWIVPLKSRIDLQT